MRLPLIAGFTLIALNVAIHAVGVVTLLRLLAAYRPFWRRHASSLVTVLSLSWVVATLVFLHMVELMVWASYFRLQGLFPDFETATYFSLATYTTTGFGDVVLTKDWRILGSVEGLVGILMMSWSGAILIGVITNIYQGLQGGALANQLGDPS